LQQGKVLPHTTYPWLAEEMEPSTFKRLRCFPQTTGQQRKAQCYGSCPEPQGNRRSLPCWSGSGAEVDRARACCWMAIAAGLNRDRVPTAHDGLRWYPGTVRAVVLSTAPELMVRGRK
jgi:hypothetical protein